MKGRMDSIDALLSTAKIDEKRSIELFKQRRIDIGLENWAGADKWLKALVESLTNPCTYGYTYDELDRLLNFDSGITETAGNSPERLSYEMRYVVAARLAHLALLISG